VRVDDASYNSTEVRTLSMPEQQLVEIACAVGAGARIVVMDEPTASLDGATTTAVEALLTTWLAAGRRACVLISHDSEQIERFASRTLELQP
jgi:putative ABC transport system ATP-binding protein